MLSRPVKVLVLACVVLLGGAVAVWAYDHSRRDVIADGVKVDGVSLAGLHPAAARQRLEQALASRLERPVTIARGHHRWVITPREAGVRVNVGALVDQAVKDSRQGSIITRTVRGIFGESLHKDIPVRLSVARSGVAGIVKQVAAKLDRQPRNATVTPTVSGLQRVPGADGRTVDTRALTDAVVAGLERPGSATRIEPVVHAVHPTVTTADLAKDYPAYIIVNRSAFRLTLYKDLQPAHTYTIAVGRVGLETPAGLYHIQDKQMNPSWHVPNDSWAGALAGKVIPPGPQDPIKARWMGIFNGAGIHGTDELSSLGSAASHGCIRMAIPDVINLYNQVSVGTPVYIF